MERSGMFSATYTSQSTVTKRCLKLKLQIYTEPRHCISILLCTVPQLSTLSSTDAKALEVGWSCAALALVLRFETQLFLILVLFQYLLTVCRYLYLRRTRFYGLSTSEGRIFKITKSGEFTYNENGRPRCRCDSVCQRLRGFN